MLSIMLIIIMSKGRKIKRWKRQNYKVYNIHIKKPISSISKNVRYINNIVRFVKRIGRKKTRPNRNLQKIYPYVYSATADFKFPSSVHRTDISPCATQLAIGVPMYGGRKKYCAYDILSFRDVPGYAFPVF